MSRYPLALTALAAAALSAPALAQSQPAKAISHVGVEIEVPAGFRWLKGAKPKGKDTAIYLAQGGDFDPVIAVFSEDASAFQSEKQALETFKGAFRFYDDVEEAVVDLPAGQFFKCDYSFDDEDAQGAKLTRRQRFMATIKNGRVYTFVLGNCSPTQHKDLAPKVEKVIGAARFFAPQDKPLPEEVPPPGAEPKPEPEPQPAEPEPEPRPEPGPGPAPVGLSALEAQAAIAEAETRRADPAAVEQILAPVLSEGGPTLAPEQQAQALRLRANARFVGGNLKGARRDYDTLLTLPGQAEDVFTLLGSARVHHGLGLADAAASEWKRAKELDPAVFASTQEAVGLPPAEREAMAKAVAAPASEQPAAEQPGTAQLGQPSEPENLLSGGQVVSFSSEYDPDIWAAKHLIDGDSERGWCSAPRSRFPHRFVLALSRPSQLTRVSFDTRSTADDYEGVAARGFRLEASVLGPDRGFKEVLVGSLRSAQDDQSFPLETGKNVRWLRLTLESNHGHPTLTELMELEVYGTGVTANTSERPAASGFRLDQARVSRTKNGEALAKDGSFRPGQKVWLNFKPRELTTKDGKYWLQADLLLLDDEGNELIKRPRVVDHVSQLPNPPLSPFVSLHLTLPDGFPAGRYVVKLFVRDQIGGASAASTLEFAVAEDF